MNLKTLLLILVPTVIQAQQKTAQYYYSQAKEAYKSGDNNKFYDMIVEANKLHPYNQTIMYQRAIAATLNNKLNEAIHFLQEALLINSTFDLTINDLSPLFNLKEFKELQSLQESASTPIIHSDTAFTIKDRLLHAETVTPGERKGVFYVSSIHKRKVERVDANNTMSDFLSSGQDGITSVLGIKVDPQKKYLWLCSSPMQEMQDFDSTLQSSVFKYDLKTKKLLKKFTIKQESVFGDMILNKKGEAFISDSKNNIIYKANEKPGTLDNYFTSPEFWNIQGITFSEDEAYIFIADYIKGIYRFNVKSNELVPVLKDSAISLKSIDGLLFYKNSLIAIQNGIEPMRVTQYYLNDSLDKITGYKIIDRGHPAFNEPTNGCIVDNTLYYVANSQWGAYDKKHKPKPEDQLQDIVILKYPLNK